MALTDQVCRIQFIPKNQDTFRAKSAKDTIAQYLNMNEFTIGSSKEANIIYKMKGIHPIHLRVRVEGRELFVEDVFSSTGVTINGKIIKPGERVPYKAGEFIQLGTSPDIITVEMFRKPVDPRLESQHIVLEAEKKANEIIRDANTKMQEATLADEKAQGLIDAAKGKADEVLGQRKKELELLYEERVRSAIQEGQDRADQTSKSIMESAQKEVHLMLMNARNEAEDIRRQGESKKQEALKVKEGILKENEELIRRREELEKHIENVLSENEDILKKNAELIDKAQQIENQYETVEEEFKTFKGNIESKKQEALRQVSDIEDEYSSIKQDLELAQRNCKAACEETDFQKEKKGEITAQISEAKEEVQNLKREIEKIEESKKEAMGEAEKVKEEARSQMDDVKQKLEDEYQKRKQKEVERLQAMREREQVRLYQTIDDLSIAIMDELEFEISGLNSETHKLFIEKAVKRVIIEEFELREKVVIEEPEILLKKEKDSIKTPSFHWPRKITLPIVALIGAIGFFAIKSQFFQYEEGGVFENVNRQVQSVGENNQEEKNLSSWKNSYTENILFTKKYLKFTKRQKVNKRMKARLEKFLRTELQLSKDAIVKLNVQESMLIWELKKIKNQIKPRNKQAKIEEMKSKEKDLIRPLIEVLGGPEQLSRYFEFQRQQFFNNTK